MTKRIEQQPFPKILKLIQIINYIVIASAILLSLTFLLISPDEIAQANGNIQPLNQYIVGVLYLVYAGVTFAVTYSIRKRKSYAPKLFILMIFMIIPLDMTISHYANIPHLADTTAVIIMTIDYIVTGLAIAYFLFSKKISTIFIQ